MSIISWSPDLKQVVGKMKLLNNEVDSHQTTHSNLSNVITESEARIVGQVFSSSQIQESPPERRIYWK